MASTFQELEHLLRTSECKPNSTTQTNDKNYKNVNNGSDQALLPSNNVTAPHHHQKLLRASPELVHTLRRALGAIEGGVVDTSIFALQQCFDEPSTAQPPGGAATAASPSNRRVPSLKFPHKDTESNVPTLCPTYLRGIASELLQVMKQAGTDSWVMPPHLQEAVENVTDAQRISPLSKLGSVWVPVLLKLHQVLAMLVPFFGVDTNDDVNNNSATLDATRHDTNAGETNCLIAAMRNAEVLESQATVIGHRYMDYHVEDLSTTSESGVLSTANMSSDASPRDSPSLPYNVYDRSGGQLNGVHSQNGEYATVDQPAAAQNKSAVAAATQDVVDWNTVDIYVLLEDGDWKQLPNESTTTATSQNKDDDFKNLGCGVYWRPNARQLIITIDLQFLVFAVTACGRYDTYIWALFLHILSPAKKIIDVPLRLPSFFVSWQVGNSKYFPY
eukprot:Lankesteria_metandrocarpae@DN10328_c0_g1_i1.p1